MRLPIYLDDSVDQDLLIRVLRNAGHKVTSPREVDLMGKDDPIHFDFARKHSMVLVTRDPGDFIAMHDDLRAHGEIHPGILLVYRDNDPRDMKPHDIVRAIDNLLNAGVEIADEVHNLNFWR